MQLNLLIKSSTSKKLFEGTWKFLVPILCNVGVMDVIVQRSVRGRADEVDVERVPERPERVPALGIATGSF